MNPHELRRRFLEFFEAREHRTVSSSPVVPKGDPTLLFANAGMNQFKDVFLGNEVRDYKRAASAQMCIRAGGKHNDLDEVGKDGRHLTFFEMLGTWSFGDYYKRDSIRWGWEFIGEVLELDLERVYVSVHHNDDESYDIWRDDIGIPVERLVRLGDEDNFWSMGPVGPCGPCTEIHYDLQPEKPYGFGTVFDGERYVELWNHVFMEFDRSEDGTMKPLAMKSVDTGMGLERAAVIMAGVDSVYKTGLFKNILESTARLLGIDAQQMDILAREDHIAFCVIADHIRTLTFAVSEGQPFSNEGRGYVLRRILRRAVRHGRALGFEGPFMHEVAQAVIDDFGEVYPGLRPVAQQTREVIRLEEERFFRTIDRGIHRFNEAAAKLQKKKKNVIPGQDAFTLYDTFGFPLDLTCILAEEHGMTVDVDGFEEALEEQRVRSAGQNRFYKDEAGPWLTANESGSDTFVGYDRLETASVINRYRPRGDYFEVLLDITPFYAESGGQVGDRGVIYSESGALRFEVLDTQRAPIGIIHLCQLTDGFATPEAMKQDLIARVDGNRRACTASNHTATHLLHAALHEVVSVDALQAGSLVNEEKLRFDFTYPKALTDEQLRGVEGWVNAMIQSGQSVVTHVDVPREKAEEMGAQAIFGEKYGERVRIVEVGDAQSVELCGGTHVGNTRDILMFRITQESAIKAGTRRIEAVTHRGAVEASQRDRALLEAATKQAGADGTSRLAERIERLQSDHSELKQYAEKLFVQIAKQQARQIIDSKSIVSEVEVFSGRVDARDRQQLLQIADFVRDRMSEGVALLGAEIEGKPALVCLVSQPLIKSRGLKAGPLVNACAQHVGGRGGGRPTLAQAGGVDSSKLDVAIQAIQGAVESQSRS